MFDLNSREFNFIGRPDGLGNRIEQIVMLEAISRQIGARVNYLWVNKHEHRSYAICLNSHNVKVLEKLEQDLPFIHIQDFENLVVGQSDILAAGKSIGPTFSVFFEESFVPVGVHLRSTDRIKRTANPRFMKNEKELREYMSSAIFNINRIKPAGVFVAADSLDLKKIFISYLSDDIKIVEPVCVKTISPEYVDFFALSLCREVWMVSKFSSFAIMASVVGNIPIKCFFDDPLAQERYRALFEVLPLNTNNFINTVIPGYSIPDRLSSTFFRLLRKLGRHES